MLHGRGAPSRLVYDLRQVAFCLVRCTSPRLSEDHARRVVNRHERRRPAHAKAAANYAIGTLARREVGEQGFDDALMLDWQGRVAEATGANLFSVVDGTIHTPVADCFLSGITRATVIDIARRACVPVVERRMLPAELADADEVFLSGTAYEIQPVRAIDGTEYAPGPVTRWLREEYEALVHTKHQ